MPSSRLPLWLALLAACGCASVDPAPDYARAQEEIRAATGVADVHDPLEPALTEAELEALLADGLGLDEATRLALLNNRRLQAGFLGLGVARADYVQAGLLANPSLSLAFLFPDAGGRVRWTAGLAGDVADLWGVPARRAIAREGLELRILELSRFAGELVAATRGAYCESLAARERRAVLDARRELAQRSLQGVRRLAAEGAVSQTDVNLAESLALAAQLEFQRGEREHSARLRELAALLSLERDLAGVALTDALAAPPWPQLEREAFVQASLAGRPDLRAAARAVAAAQARVSRERGRRFPSLAAGVSAERPEGGATGDLFLGPAATLELPLFDQNQAQVSRAEFELARVLKEREALLAEAQQELRAALERAEVAARAAAFAQDELLAQAERARELAERAFELGDTTVLTLLAARRVALEARQAVVETLLEAALARIEAERAAGAPLRASADR